MIVSQKYQDLLQPNSHDRFSKLLRTFYASRKLWIYLCTLKEKLPIFLINTLLLHIPLLALTHRQNYRGTNTLAARGLEELFISCAVVSVFGSGGKYVLVLHTTTYVLRVQYSCGVVLVFWSWREIVFGLRTYLVYNSVVRLCQLFGCGGK